MAGKQYVLQSILEGHSNWVTSLSTTRENPYILVSGSRDKTLMYWRASAEGEFVNNPVPIRSMTGHNQAVQDVVLSSDGQFALSGSWDKTLRLWELETGSCIREFKGHESDVFSVAFSTDNRQIVSCGRDKTIRLWNTLADCKLVIRENQHTDWISCIRFSPCSKNPVVVSAGRDKKVKLWNLNAPQESKELIGHTGIVNTVTVSPDGSLCASGGSDGVAMLWAITEEERQHLYSLEAGSTINALCFSPRNYWLCAATDNCIKIWDLESKSPIIEIPAHEDFSKKNGLPWIVSLAWSYKGDYLYAGSTNGKIYMYHFDVTK